MRRDGGQAIDAQRLRLGTDFLCRTSQSWFHPRARLALLPHGDAFQVWPADRLPLVLTDVGGVQSAQEGTYEDRFTTSLTYPGTSELAFHEASGANAVVMHAHGSTYACVPSYADHETIRSAAFSALGRDLPSSSSLDTFFARILPPLDQLPPVQFVARPCKVTCDQG